MKTLLLLLVALIPFTFIYAQPTTGLVAHWNFNGTAMDVSGNGHHGNPVNLSYTNGANGSANSAAVFNGSSSFVSVPHDDDFNVTKFSIVSVFRVNGFYTSTCQGNFILQRGAKWVNGSYGLHFTDNYYDNSCTVTGDTSNFYLGFDAGPGNSSIPNTSWQTIDTVRTGGWYCVVATYDSSKLRVYINGQLSTTVTTVNGPLNVGSSTDSLSIGANRFGNFAQFPYWFNGLIDELMLYNRVLTPTEISNYCGSITAPADTTVKLSPVPSTLCLIDSVYKFDYTVNKNFNIGNVFSLELSDATGSFATPLNLGSVTSITDGSISGILPTSLQPGNGYLLRIVSTDPIRTYVTPQTVTIANAAVPQVTITPPAMPIMPDTTVIFTASATNAGINPMYVWRQNNQIISSSISNTLQINTNQLQHKDSIMVDVVVTEGCSQGVTASSSPVILWMSASSVSNINGATFSCYPNPTSGIVLLKGSVTVDGTYSISVLNVLGQKVYTSFVASQQGTVSKSIDLSGVSTGTYMIHISSDKGESVMRIVVE